MEIWGTWGWSLSTVGIGTSPHSTAMPDWVLIRLSQRTVCYLVEKCICGMLTTQPCYWVWEKRLSETNPQEGQLYTSQSA